MVDFLHKQIVGIGPIHMVSDRLYIHVPIAWHSPTLSWPKVLLFVKESNIKICTCGMRCVL